MHVEIITIGDELVLGHTIDTNGAFLGKALAALGIAVSRRTVVGDASSAIVDAVATALRRADGVITTGGLGPTSDDLTKPAIAALFERPLVLHQPTVDAIEARWRARGLPGEMPQANRQQAMVPQGADILSNRHGTAPGLWIEHAAGGWVAMLPGVPREMRGVWTDELLPRLRERVGDDPPVIRSRMLRLTGIAESRVADILATVVLPDALALAYLPGWEGVDLRVTSSTRPATAADAVLATAIEVLRTPLAAYVYADDSGDLAVGVVDALRRRGWTLAVGESCTGGLLGARVTQVPGSSDVLRGGVIAYANDVKSDLLHVAADRLAQFGAVSTEVAIAMAEGARQALGADVGVGITGIAGPGGATPEKPVGLVCIAVATPDGVHSEASRFIGDREEIRLRATQAALSRVLHAARRTSAASST